ncbi:MAG: glycosyltransferase family 8 protein [Hyphomonadaceae bacterium]
MIAPSSPVNVALGVDRLYAPHAAVVIASIVAHAPSEAFRFLILHFGIERPLQMQVEACAPGAVFVWREMDDADVPQMEDRQHISRATLFRLGIEKYAPADWSRLIYLDADLIVTDDLRELWGLDLQGRPIGAVIDSFLDADAFARRWALDPALASYFNAGVLLLDLAMVRSDSLFTKALTFVAKNIDDMPFADQDALNYAIWGRWTRLPTRWNVQRHMAIPSLIATLDDQRRLGDQSPGIVHFTGPEKPWLSEGYHPWAWLYWRHLARTPFEREIAGRHGVGRLKRALLWQRWMRRRAR